MQTLHHPPSIDQANIFLLHCSYCPYNTLLISKFISHLQSAHSNVKCAFKFYRCSHCGLTTTSYSLLVEHSVLTHHELKCSIDCIYDSNSESGIEDGTGSTSNSKSQPSPQPVSTSEPKADPDLFCYFCPYETTQPKNLTIHYTIYHGVKNVVLLSPSSISESARLRRNIPVAHSNFDKSGSPVAPNCNSESQPEGNVVIGNVNTDENKVNSDAVSPAFTCSHCGNKYRKARYFNEHVVSCSRSKNLSCPCGRVLKWRSNWYTHRKTCAIYNRLKSLGECGMRKSITNLYGNEMTTTGAIGAMNFDDVSASPAGSSFTGFLPTDQTSFVNFFGGLDFRALPSPLTTSVSSDSTHVNENVSLPLTQLNSQTFSNVSPMVSWSANESYSCNPPDATPTSVIPKQEHF